MVGHVLPEQPVHREREIAQLGEAFERVATGGHEMVIIEGEAGSGKTGVLDAIAARVAARRGFVIRGRFDALDRPIAYGALIVGVRQLVEQLLTESDVRLAQWRSELKAALGAEAGALVEAIPALEHVIGKQPPAGPLAQLPAQARFKRLLDAFVDVACQPGRPIAIVLDDAHKADDASLAFVAQLAIDETRAHLLIVCAHRAGGVDARAPLWTFLGRVEASLAPLRLVLGPLDRDALAASCARLFGVEPAATTALADVLARKTGGSPVAVRQFLRAMADSGAIAFERGWTWDLARIEAAALSDDFAVTVAVQLAALPDATRELVAVAACLGERFTLGDLAIATGQAAVELARALEPAAHAGLISHASNNYRFVDDRARDRARAAMPAGEEDRVHVGFALALLERSSPNGRERLGDIVDHLNAGAAALDDHGERSALNAEAGRGARTAGRHAAARQYLRAALDALDTWSVDHQRAFSLHTECAEAELLAGDPVASDALLEVALARARTDLQRVAVYRQRLWQDTARGLGERAIESGRRALELLGVELPTGDQALRQRLAAVEARLADRPIAGLVELAEVADAHVRATMDLLDALQPSTFLFAQPLYASVTLELVALSLRHGNSPASVSGYGAMFSVLWMLRGDPAAFQTAHELGQVALQLAERYGSDAQRSRAMIRLGACITGWVAPAHETLSILDEGYRIGVGAGELQSAGLNLQYKAINAHFVGTNLDQLGPELERDARFARKHGLEVVSAMLEAVQLPIRRLVGAVGGALTADDFVAKHHTWPAHVACHLIFDAEALFVLGELPAALEQLARARERLGDIAGLLGNVTHAVTHSLVLAQLRPTLSESARFDVDRQIIENQGRIATWSASCRANFEHLYLVVEAERARLRGDRLTAIDAYDDAIAAAAKHGFGHHEAIAAELAGRFWLAEGRDQIGATYLRRALLGYRRWGATKVVERLLAAHPMLRDEAGTGAGSLGSVLEASRAISEEVEFDALVARLMQIVIDHTGAEHGAVVVKEESGLVVYATGAPRGAALDASGDVPISLIRYVVRSGKLVSIEDALADAARGRDPDVQRRMTRSLLAVPMVARGTIRGTIYLEHRAAHTFTPDRVRFVEVLASQAAISVDNAVLYRSLSATNRELEQALDKVEDHARLRKELEIGARIQTSILPVALVVPGLDIAARMVPASEVGGDYYDVIPVHDGAWLGIGDVAGHGLDAGLVMLMAQSAIAALARQRPDARPSEIVCAANEQLYENVRVRLRRDEHVTLSLLRYHDDGRIVFAGAHEDILVSRAATREHQWMSTPGPWLGVRRDIRHVTPDSELVLEHGDLLVLYTDGITEAMDASRKQFGADRLADVVEAHFDDAPDVIRDHIVDAVGRWSAERRDDLTVLVARRR